MEYFDFPKTTSPKSGKSSEALLQVEPCTAETWANYSEQHDTIKKEACPMKIHFVLVYASRHFPNFIS